MTKYLIVFSDSEPLEACANPTRRDRLLYRFLRMLKPGFRHVYAMRRAENFDGWILLNWHSSGADVLEIKAGETITHCDFEYADYGMLVQDMISAGAAHGVEVEVPEFGHWQPRGISTCVTAIKHLCGVNAPFVLTPWQLWRHLERKNA